MADREKVIKGLECCIKRDPEDDLRCDACPYPAGSACENRLKIDALELLEAKYEPRESRKMLPCKCGCKRREHWYGYNSEGLKCIKCGFEVWGKNAADVIRKWNEAVTRKDEPPKEGDEE